MKRIIMLDPERCVGCRQCALSCSFNKDQLFSLGKARITTLWAHNAGINVPMICQHCDKAPCIDICLTRAISRNEETGATVIDLDRCIGCKMCIMICPFGAITWDTDNRSIIKCDLCDGDPECVKHCLYGAIEWIDADKAALSRRQSVAAYFAEALTKLKELN